MTSNAATAPAAPKAKRDRTHYLYIAVIVAVVAGVTVGLVWPALGVALRPIGTAFVNLIKMIISPVIFCTIVLGIGSIREAAKVGKVGSLALLYFVVMSTFALIIGLVVGNILQPGAGLLRPADEELVEVEPRSHEAVVGVGRQLGPGQLEVHAAADDAQPTVADEAVALAGVDAEVDQALDGAWGEAVAAHLLAREGRLLQQQDVEARLGERVRRCAATRAGADDDDVGVPVCAHVLDPRSGLLWKALVKVFTSAPPS